MSLTPSHSAAWHWPAAFLLALGIALVHRGSFVNVEHTFSPGGQTLAGMAEVREVIERRWVEEPKERQLLNGSLRGMMGTLDPFSEYISTEQKEQFEQSTTGKFGGLGIWISVEDGLVVVISPIEDTPAWKAGILPGDKILQVDGVPCEFKNAPAAVRALKGEAGSSVVLTVLHEGSRRPVDIKITRAVITIRSVKGARLLDEESKVGYLRITTFNSGTLSEFAKAIVALSQQGMRALLVDLRGNPGGFLDQAIKIANLFLEEDKVIVKTWSRESGRYRDTVANDERLITVPTALLLNRGSASASEVLAGALQDHEVATIVGQRSYGKGSVQTIIPVLGGKAELKLTTQYYFTPDGRRIHRGTKKEEDTSWGLLPEVKVPISARLRWELTQKESNQEIERLKALAKGKTWKGEERLHLDDPQVRSAYAHLLEKLGDPLPAKVKAAIADAAKQAAKVKKDALAGGDKQPKQPETPKPPVNKTDAKTTPKKTSEPK